MELEPQYAKYGLPKKDMHQVWLATKELPNVLPAVADAFQSDFYSKLTSGELRKTKTYCYCLKPTVC